MQQPEIETELATRSETSATESWLQNFAVAVWSPRPPPNSRCLGGISALILWFLNKVRDVSLSIFGGTLRKCKYLQPLVIAESVWQTWTLGLLYLETQCHFFALFSMATHFPLWIRNAAIFFTKRILLRSCSEAASVRYFNWDLHWVFCWAATESSYKFRHYWTGTLKIRKKSGKRRCARGCWDNQAATEFSFPLVFFCFQSAAYLWRLYFLLLYCLYFVVFLERHCIYSMHC